MAVQPVTYQENLGGPLLQRQPSPAIWGDCPWSQILEQSQPGLAFYDDFQDFPLMPTITTQIGVAKYKAFATSGSTLTRVKSINSVAVPGGSLSANLDADTHSASLAQAYSSYFLNGVGSVAGKLWFECCIATNAMTANTQGFFVGLAETDLFTLATGVPFSSDTGLAVTNGGAMLGFNLASNGLGVIRSCYNDRATTLTSVGATDASFSAAYTFTRLGMVYDPSKVGTVSTQPKTCAIQFYQDNVILPNGITSATLLATTNLAAQPLGLMFANIAGSSVSSGANYLKWWKVAQLLPS